MLLDFNRSGLRVSPVCLLWYTWHCGNNIRSSQLERSCPDKALLCLPPFKLRYQKGQNKPSKRISSYTYFLVLYISFLRITSATLMSIFFKRSILTKLKLLNFESIFLDFVCHHFFPLCASLFSLWFMFLLFLRLSFPSLYFLPWNYFHSRYFNYLLILFDATKPNGPKK